MFVPIEAAFFAAMNNDEKLFEDAFKKNIIIVTPSTLLLTLRIIENIWQYEYQGSMNIRAGILGKLQKKPVIYTTNLQVLLNLWKI